MKLERLLEKETNAGKFLKKHWEVSLIDYLSNSIPKELPENEHRKVMFEAMKKHIKHMHKELNDEEIEYSKRQFLKRPAIQVADSSGLLLSKEIFLNNFLFQIAVRQANDRFMFTQQCSTVKNIMNSKNLEGPAYLNHGPHIYKIFNKSKNTLRNSSAATLKNVTLTFNPEGEKTPLYANADLPQLLKELKGMSFERASKAILHANKHIWGNLSFKAKKDYICFDEDLSSDVLSQYIEEGSPIKDIIFDEKIRNKYFEVKKRNIEKSTNYALRDTSDLFYYGEEEELLPARISGNKLYNPRTNEEINIELDEKSIVKNLRSRNLYPNLIVAYLTIETLPQTVVFGGASQLEYLPTIHNIAKELKEETGVFSNELSNIKSGVVGPAILQLDEKQERVLQYLNSRTDLDKFEESFAQSTIGEAIGNLEYYDYYETFFRRND